MNRKAMIILAVLLLMVIAFYCVMLDLSWISDGRTYTFKEVWDSLQGKGSWGSNIIVRDINAPRVVAGLFIGAGLAIAGTAMQAVFRNPLASPYLLGLSSGASVGAAASMLFTISFIPAAIVTPVLAFVACFGTMILVYTMARAGGAVKTESLILSGVAVSSLLSALVSLLTFISGDKLEGIVFWTMGNLSQVEWDEIYFMAPVICVCAVFLMTQSKNLNAMMLGDLHAMDLGVDVKRTRLFVLIMTTMIVASAVSFAGVIGFIGLVIPHILRILLGPDNRTIMPISIVAGAAFILICDYLAHIVMPQYGVLPIGVITALVGAPIFIYLLIRRKREVGWN